HDPADPPPVQSRAPGTGRRQVERGGGEQIASANGAVGNGLYDVGESRIGPHASDRRIQIVASRQVGRGPVSVEQVHPKVWREGVIKAAAKRQLLWQVHGTQDIFADRRETADSGLRVPGIDDDLLL